MEKPFLAALAEGVLLADGAMGTEIYSRGIPMDRCYGELNLSAPELIGAIHASYIQAGAQVIETNTFGANPASLAAHGLEAKAREINLRGAEIARKASGGLAYVAGSVGPAACAGLSEPRRFAAYASQIEALRDGGVALLILETFSHLQEAGIAYRAARAVSRLPVVVQFSFHNPELTPGEATKAAGEWGADAVGTNCNSPEETLEYMERATRVGSIRLSAMPCAGLPVINQGRAFYPTSPRDMAAWARRLVQAGISLIGGCCGTTPAMIKEMGSSLRPLNL